MKLESRSSQTVRLLNYLDSSLRDGKRPEPDEMKSFDREVYLPTINEHNLGLIYLPDRGIPDFGPRSSFLESQKRQVLTGSAIQAGVFGALGAFFGAQTGVETALLGAAAGVFLGVDGALYRETGKVTVKVDGEAQASRRFFGDASSFELKPEELHLRLTAQGFLGDRIQAAAVPAVTPDSAAWEKWKGVSGSLKSLERERRLVADLGGISDYGKPVLQLVTALQAAELLASGFDVSIVSGRKEDLQRRLEVDASNREKTRVHHEKHEFVERHFDYQLQALHDPEQLRAIPAGEGLPEGMLGLARDEKRTVAIVGQSDQNQEIAIGGDSVYQSFQYHRATADPQVDLQPNSPNYAVARFWNLTPLPTLLGVLVGGLIADAFNPTAGLLGMVGGGLVGREAGRYLTSKSKIEPPPSSLRIRYPE